MHSYGEHLADAGTFASFLAPLKEIKWYVHIQSPFAGPESVLAYLSRYTHRLAIANSHLIAADRNGITFKCKNYRLKAAVLGELFSIAGAPPHLNDRAFAAARYDKLGLESPHRVLDQAIQCIVVVRRIVVKKHQLLYTHPRCKLECVAIGAVPPSDAALVLLISVLGVMDQQISAGRKIVAGGPFRLEPSAVSENYAQTEECGLKLPLIFQIGSGDDV